MLWPQRLIATSGILLFTFLCWAWIAPMARDMYGPMTGLSAWMMTDTWDRRHVLLLWLMWAVMMGAMMLPSAMPLLLLYDGVLRRRAGATHVALHVHALAAGYLLTWAAFSAGATALQRVLSRMLVLNPMMEMSGAAVGTTLLLAGGYQLTPWKGACLHVCRSPLGFVMRRWRNGLVGAVKMGIEHGAYCLGCCWAIMLLLFAGGVMNLTVIIGLTLLVLVEKVSPVGRQASLVSGAVMIAVGVWWLLR